MDIARNHYGFFDSNSWSSIQNQLDLGFVEPVAHSSELILLHLMKILKVKFQVVNRTSFKILICLYTIDMGVMSIYTLGLLHMVNIVTKLILQLVMENTSFHVYFMKISMDFQIRSIFNEI